jgi:UDP-glucose 4-epimerase
VSDLADAHVLAFQHLLCGGLSCALNLGKGPGHSVREVIDAVERLSGRKVRVRIRPRRERDPPVVVARSSRPMELPNWSPRQSNLEMMVRTVWRWQESLMLSEAVSESADQRTPTRRATASAI